MSGGTVYQTIVVGGGVVGLSTAYHCVSVGAPTLLIDGAHAGRATDAGAGILSPETNTRDSDAWFEFGVKAVEYYSTLLECLRADEAGDTGYARSPLLLVANEAPQIEMFEAAKTRIFGRQKRRGTPSLSDLHEISAEEARRAFPPLGEVHRALYYRHAARVDGRLLSQALRRAAERRGLVMKQASVSALRLKGKRVVGVSADGEWYSAEHVVIAGGAWSRAFADQLGVDFPVDPQRGQIVHLRTPDPSTSDWAIVNGFRGHYIVAWPGGRVVVGATRETGSGFEARLTAGGVREVLSEALRMAPSLSNAEILDMRVGLRPVTPDNLPVLGAVPGIEGAYLATGHGPTGLQLGPYSGKVVADMTLGRPIDIDLNPFQVTRFQ